MKEVRVKLEQISKEGGKSLEESKGKLIRHCMNCDRQSNDICVIALQELDLDGDWDPDMHDKQMADIYAQDEDYPAAEEEKPQWNDDIDIADIVPDHVEETDRKKKKKKKKVTGTRDGEGGVDVEDMDVDVYRAEDEEEWDGTEEMRKRKLDEYMDELYGMEFNDMVRSRSSLSFLHFLVALKYHRILILSLRREVFPPASSTPRSHNSPMHLRP